MPGMEPGHFTVLPEPECRRLVRSQTVGRVCWLSRDDGLQALPVTFQVFGELILFAVDPHSVMGELFGSVPVAFEVDDIDVETATGWSVLVRGDAGAWESRNDVGLPAPWAPGHRTLRVAITPHTYTGRAVSADDPRN